MAHGDSRARKAVPKVSESEWEVLKPLWDEGPMAARDIFRRVPPDRAWAYKTVKTLITRLVKKGALTFEQIGNSYLYAPAFTREEMTGAATRSFVERVFDGALQPFVAHFARQASPEEIRALRIELSRIEEEQLGKEDRS